VREAIVVVMGWIIHEGGEPRGVSRVVVVENTNLQC